MMPFLQRAIPFSKAKKRRDPTVMSVWSVARRCLGRSTA